MRFFNKLIFFTIFLTAQVANAKLDFSCSVFTEKYSKIYNLPDKLLTSISLVESGIKKENKIISWPWTLNVSGKSKYFKNKEDVLFFLKSNAQKKNIDVGCMQINLKYHEKEFDSIESIIDPEKNVKYAAKFLKSLFKKHKRWNEAISRYHSSSPVRKKIYLRKVQNYWSKIRQRRIKTFIDFSEKEKKKIEFFKEQFKDQIYHLNS